MKKRRMAAFAATVVLMAGVFTGCGSTKLAESFDQQNVTDTAEEVLDLLNVEDYEGVTTAFSEELAEVLPAEKLEETVKPILQEAGTFEEYESSTVIGQNNKQTGEDNAIAVIVAKYENKKLTYTVSFDPEMEINGLYVK